LKINGSSFCCKKYTSGKDWNQKRWFIEKKKRHSFLNHFTIDKKCKMKITSKAFEDNQTIPVQYTCEGPNVSPPLEFHDIPEQTKSLVLLVEDPDAPAKPWVHWFVFNIPPKATGFDEDSIAEGAQQGLCNGNTLGYEGPCPPENEHTYLFKLYALDIVLPADPVPDRKKALPMMEGHVIEEALLRGKYEKENKCQSGGVDKEKKDWQHRAI
jgi:hypothetical protein